MNINRKGSQKDLSGIASQNSMGRKGNSQKDLQKFEKQNENTFLTQTKQPEGPTHSLHDFLFPAGKVAKLVNRSNLVNLRQKYWIRLTCTINSQIYVRNLDSEIPHQSFIWLEQRILVELNFMQEFVGLLFEWMLLSWTLE
jgi:hypothetical protein